jgi:hypothetical protein
MAKKDVYTKEERSRINKEYYLKNKEERRKIAKEYYHSHKEQRHAYNKEWRKRNPSYKQRNPEKDVMVKRWRKSNLKKFGLDIEKYNAILEQQDYKCAICGIEINKLKRNLAIDHDHKTGKVRGLLCFRCNVTLGRFDDDIELFNKIINYLKLTNNEAQMCGQTDQV